MRTVPTFAVSLLGKPGLGTAAKGVVAILGIRELLPCSRINILRTILLTTLPTPTSPTSLPHLEFVCMIKATCENIVAGRIFEAPPLAPRTLLRIL